MRLHVLATYGIVYFTDTEERSYSPLPAPRAHSERCSANGVMTEGGLAKALRERMCTRPHVLAPRSARAFRAMQRVRPTRLDRKLLRERRSTQPHAELTPYPLRPFRAIQPLRSARLTDLPGAPLSSTIPEMEGAHSLRCASVASWPSCKRLRSLSLCTRLYTILTRFPDPVPHGSGAVSA
jgi:hypothetical protein